MTRPGPGARLDAGRFTLPWSPGLAGLFPLIDDGIAEPEPPSNVRREAALRYYRERAERNCAGVFDMWRRHGLYLSRTTPALDARALEVEPGASSARTGTVAGGSTYRPAPRPRTRGAARLWTVTTAW